MGWGIVGVGNLGSSGDWGGNLRDKGVKNWWGLWCKVKGWEVKG